MERIAKSLKHKAKSTVLGVTVPGTVPSELGLGLAPHPLGASAVHTADRHFYRSSKFSVPVPSALFLAQTLPKVHFRSPPEEEAN